MRYNLDREGYQVICAMSGEEALEAAVSEPMDLIILDLMLPGIDGLEVAPASQTEPVHQGNAHRHADRQGRRGGCGYRFGIGGR